MKPVRLAKAALAVATASLALAATSSWPASAAGLDLPASLAAEHDHVREELSRAAREPGKLGTAARSLQAVLEPHLVAEESMALPPLALLVPLSRGESPPDRSAAIHSTARLHAMLPELIKDHAKIGVAAAALRQAAWSARRPDYAELADAIMRHARLEEEVLYPAALLVGRAIRPAVRPAAPER